MGSLTSPTTRALPVSVRERRPALATLAVLLILGGALASTVLVMRADERTSVIRVVKYVGAGLPIEPEAMQEALIADPGGDYRLWRDREQVAKTFASVTLLPGTLLTSGMAVPASKELVPGKARVGLALKPGQVTDGLKVGQRVQVIHVPGTSVTAGREGTLLAQRALVDQVETAGRGPTGQVTVIVDSDVSTAVAAYASTGQIVIVEVPEFR
ncbi:hypothetical protein HII36_09600 [Nonomuraea sp. NN258]|nr:hypothetical protein [Nonomuraea antri]